MTQGRIRVSQGNPYHIAGEGDALGPDNLLANTHAIRIEMHHDGCSATGLGEVEMGDRGFKSRRPVETGCNGSVGKACGDHVFIL